MRIHKLTILEGKWFKDSNVSVRDIIRPMFEIWSKGDSDYHYEMFTTEDSFRAAIKYAFGNSQPGVIYVASHGDENALRGFRDEAVSRAIVRNALRQDGATKRGILFGSCLFVSRDNAKFLLLGKKLGCERVQWVAGYSKEVDWVEASSLEMFFLKHLLFPAPNRRRGERDQTGLEKLELACRRVRELIKPLADKLGFNVFCRQKGPGGALRNLLDPEASGT